MINFYLYQFVFIIIMIIFDIVLIFGPVIGYVSQYNIIKENKSVGSFSIDICAILLIANILRIFFWCAHGFGLPLLFQSILMIIAQILLLKICIDVHKIQNKLPQQDQSETAITPIPSSKKSLYMNFWRWTQFKSYIKFIIGFTILLTLITLVFVIGIKNQYYGSMIGYLSTLTEATLGFPQLISNFRTKNVEGLSSFLIGTWFFGDLGKTLYFVFDQQPIQFILCGAMQLSLDIMIIVQVIIYKKKLVI